MKSEKTKLVIKLLRDKGFVPQPRGKCAGSHTIWKLGTTMVSIPDGHTVISPGIMRKVNRALENV